MGRTRTLFTIGYEQIPHKAVLELYQVSAVTEGTDAQATVSVRLTEDGLPPWGDPVSMLVHGRA